MPARGWVTPRLLCGLAVAALAGCASTAPEDRPVRLYEKRDLAQVAAAVLDACLDAEAQPSEARPAAAGQGTVIRAMAIVGHPQPLALVLEVSVVQAAEGVRVSVTAEPAGRERVPFEPGGTPAQGAGREGCSACPTSDRLVPTENAPHDNLLALSESKRLVARFFVALDERLQ